MTKDQIDEAFPAELARDLVEIMKVHRLHDIEMQCRLSLRDHPDLKPDADGVGHIVFSADQARSFANLLLKRAAESEDLEMERLIVARQGEQVTG